MKKIKISVTIMDLKLFMCVSIQVYDLIWYYIWVLMTSFKLNTNRGKSIDILDLFFKGICYLLSTDSFVCLNKLLYNWNNSACVEWRTTWLSKMLFNKYISYVLNVWYWKYKQIMIQIPGYIICFWNFLSLIIQWQVMSLQRLTIRRECTLSKSS